MRQQEKQGQHLATPLILVRFWWSVHQVLACSGGRDGHIEAIAVIHLVEFVLRFEIAQLGIGQHGSRPGLTSIP